MASIDRSYSEKRDFIRMRVNSPVVITQEGKDFQGICKDLSGAGMLVQAEQALEIGSDVTVSIEQKCETHLPFKATASVSRIDQQDEGFLIGLHISDIHD